MLSEFETCLRLYRPFKNELHPSWRYANEVFWAIAVIVPYSDSVSSALAVGAGSWLGMGKLRRR